MLKRYQTMKRWLLVASLMLAVVSVGATKYYVSPKGTGTAYSKQAPGGLSDEALSMLKADDVLYLMDGQYDITTQLSLRNSGSAGHYITVCAAPGAKPVLDFRQQSNGSKSNGLKVMGSYVWLRDLTICYAGYKGVWLEKAAHCILERLEVYGCCNAGIQLRSGGYNMVLNCDAHHNFDYQDEGGNADGFADKQGDPTPGNIYVGCRAWGNSDDGWDSYGRTTKDKPTAYIHCITYNNGPATFNLTNHPRATGVDKELPCMAGKDLTSYPNGGNPNGFKVGGKGSLHDVELYECLAVGHQKKGFDQNNNAGHMKITNCTAYKNRVNYGFGNKHPYTLTITNCLSMAPEKSDFDRYEGATIVSVNNTWDAQHVQQPQTDGRDIERVVLAERQVDGSLSDAVLKYMKGLPSGKKEADVAISGLTVSTEPVRSDMPCFDLYGRSVAKGYHGLVLQDGELKMMK